MLGTVALAPVMPGREGASKRELMVTRIAQRLALKEATLWGRLRELRQSAQSRSSRQTGPAGTKTEPAKVNPDPEERELLEVLLAEPNLVPLAVAEVSCDQVVHA